MTLAQARRFALSLPESTEAPHHEYTSFRVRGKIFATAPPDGDRVHVFVSEEEGEVAIGIAPEFVDTLHWGGRVAGVRVLLGKAKPALVKELIRQAWERKAPKSLRGRA